MGIAKNLQAIYSGLGLTALTAPTISFDGTSEVTMSAPFGTIRYTDDGTTPNENSTVYSSAIAVSETTTFKAIALAPGMETSDVTTYTAEINYASMPFFIQNETSTAGTITIAKNNSNANTLTIYTSTDNENWTSAGATSTSGLNITLPANGRVYMKQSSQTTWGRMSSNSYYWNYFSTASVNFSIGGNIQSILAGWDLGGDYLTTAYSYACYNMFYGNTKLVSADKLVMPATTLYTYCYYAMFFGTSLTTAPELPAASIASYSYALMFYNCNKLTKAPELPATTLTNYSYFAMFSGCTSLATAPPSLPATTLAEGCYSNMFFNCTSLTTAPELPATTLASNCYKAMFYNCSSLNYIKAMFTTTPSTTYTMDWVYGVAASGTFVQNDYATWNVTGVNGIPSGWSTVNNSLVPFYVENLTDSQGEVTFRKYGSDSPSITVYTSTNNSTWTSLGTTSTTSLRATLPANGRLYVRATTTAWNAGSSVLTSNLIKASVNHKVGGNIMSLIYGSSFSSVTLNGHNYAFYYLFFSNSKLLDSSELILPATTLSTGCYKSMFESCSNMVGAPQMLPATTLQSNCYQSMFTSCLKLKTAPYLPATSLVTSCYANMFYNCRELNYIKAMFTTTPGSSYTSSWVYGVAASGTFVKNASATWNVTGTSGIPSGWTVETAAS